MQLYTISRRSQSSSKFITAILILLLNLMPATPVFASYTPPSVPAPNVFTETSLPKVDVASGAFTLSVPLDIPPGRNSLQPDLTLDYNSQRTQDSIVGYGWQLSIPYIQRLNKTGSQNLYSGGYFTSSIDGELVSLATSTPATTSPTILDSLPLSIYQTPVGSSDSRSYTVPAGGSNNLFLVLLTNGNSTAPTATLNGSSLTFVRISGSINRAYYFVGYLANPTSGTFTMNWSPSANSDYTLLTVANAAQSSPIDVSNVTTVNRHAGRAIHPSRSFGQHQRRHRPDRHPGAADGLLSIRGHSHRHLHLPYK